MWNTLFKSTWRVKSFWRRWRGGDYSHLLFSLWICCGTLTFVKVQKRTMHLGNISPFVSLRNLAFLGFNVLQQSAQFMFKVQPSSLDQSQEMSVICWQLSCVKSLAAALWNGYPLKIEITVFGTDGMKSVHWVYSLCISTSKFFALSISHLVVEEETLSLWKPLRFLRLFPVADFLYTPGGGTLASPGDQSTSASLQGSAAKAKSFVFVSQVNMLNIYILYGFFFFNVSELNTLILKVIFLYWYFRSDIQADSKCT